MTKPMQALRNERGQLMHHYELYPLLGLRVGQHLGPEGWRKEVRGKMFYCDPASNRGHNSKHRIKVGCDICGVLIPFGRVEQHLKRADHKDHVGGGA